MVSFNLCYNYVFGIKIIVQKKFCKNLHLIAMENNKSYIFDLTIYNLRTMTKQDVVNEVSKSTGIEKVTVSKTIEALMETVRATMAKNQNIYLRGFGTFVVKKRAKKTARNISKNTTVIIPEHFVPTFKPSKELIDKIKSKKV